MDTLKKYYSIGTSFTRRYSLIILVSIFLIGLYLPYILKGGFIVDDWGVVARNSGFIDNLKSWFPLFSNRPLAALLITLTQQVFFRFAPAYILLNLCLWLGSLLIIERLLKKYFNNRFSVIFCILGSMPIIATTFIFSPVMMVVNSASVFLWSVSLYFINKYLQTNLKKYYFTSLLCIFASLLIYEIILPLLVITALYPLLSSRIKIKSYRFRELKSYLLKFLVPLTIVVGTIFLYQKVLLPKFSVVYSRLPDNFLSYFVNSGYKVFWEWLLSIIIKVPVLLISAFKNRSFGIDSLSIIFCLVILILIGVNLYKQKNVKIKHSRILLVTVLVALLACSFLFILSATDPDITGYLNRSFSTSWLLLSLIIAIVASKFGKRFLWIIIVFVILVSNVFILQRNNYIESYRLQTQIIKACADKIIDSGAMKGATVIGDVPQFGENNFNNEEVFGHEWDFGTALKIYSNNYIKDGNTLTRNKPYLLSNDRIQIEGYWETDSQNLWYCEYNQKNDSTTVYQIKSYDELTTLVEHINSTEVNTYYVSSFPKGKTDELIKNIINLNVSEIKRNILQLFKEFTQ